MLAEDPDDRRDRFDLQSHWRDESVGGARTLAPEHDAVEVDCDGVRRADAAGRARVWRRPLLTGVP
jgi:hypothetical protein